jgi:hypothetical protein
MSISYALLTEEKMVTSRAKTFKQATMLIVALSLSLMFSSAAFSQTITLSPAGGQPTTTTAGLGQWVCSERFYRYLLQ